MQRQRGELVPIGDALSGMGGPVKLIRDATPQAVHHFTQLDQVTQLVAARPLAHLPDVRAQAPAAPHVAATLPAVRRGPGDGKQSCSAGFPPGLSTRVKENQKRVAGPALPDGQGGAADRAVAAGDRTVATAPRGIVVNVSCSPRGCPVTVRTSFETKISPN